MAKHISSAEYRFIPLDSAEKIAQLEKEIKSKNKFIIKLLKAKKEN